MAQTYIIIDNFGMPLVIRDRDTAPEIRLFEDGFIAEQHAFSAINSGLIVSGCLFEFESVSEATKYVNNLIHENLWFHTYTLPYGYVNKYAYRNKGTEVQETISMDGSEIRKWTLV